MEEEVVEKGFSYFFLKNKYYFLAGFIVLFLIGFFIGLFIGGDKKESFNLEIDAKFSKAVETLNVSECRFFSKKDAIYCTILINSFLKNDKFCEQNFENISINYYSKEEIYAQPEDLCWMFMSQTTGKNYCDRIKNNKIKETCLK